ncbi:MAG: hypothetical protein KBD37_00680 [Burkholderiales bacterium]|nr:hypothetical protein [Burkholderiales bacterium]
MTHTAINSGYSPSRSTIIYTTPTTRTTPTTSNSSEWGFHNPFYNSSKNNSFVAVNTPDDSDTHSDTHSDTDSDSSFEINIIRETRWSVAIHKKRPNVSNGSEQPSKKRKLNAQSNNDILLQTIPLSFKKRVIQSSGQENIYQLKNLLDAIIQQELPCNNEYANALIDRLNVIFKYINLNTAIPPSTYTYMQQDINTIRAAIIEALKLCRKLECYTLAKEIIKITNKYNLSHDNSFYSRELLLLSLKSDDYEESIKIFEDLSQNPQNFEPNNPHLRLLKNAFTKCREDKVNELEIKLIEMINQPSTNSSQFYNDNRDNMVAFIREICKYLNYLNYVRHIKYLIPAISTSLLISDREAIIRADGINATSQILSLCRKCGNKNLFKKILEIINSYNFSCNLFYHEEVLFNIKYQGCAEAINFFKMLCENNKFNAYDSYILTSFISSFIKKEFYTDEARGMVKLVSENRPFIFDNFLPSLIILFYGEILFYQEALNYFNKCRTAYDNHPSRLKFYPALYAAIITAAVKNNNLKDAHKFMEEAITTKAFRNNPGLTQDSGDFLIDLNLHTKHIYDNYLNVEEHDPGVDTHFAKALFQYYYFHRQIKIGKVIVGRHGKDILRQTIQKLLKDLKVDYDECKGTGHIKLIYRV